MPSFELHRQLQIPRHQHSQQEQAKVIGLMRAAMGNQQWTRAADLGHRWRQSGGKGWEITLNLAISLCHSKHATERDLMTLASEIWQESKHNEAAKLGLSGLLIKMARYEDCITLLSQNTGRAHSLKQPWQYKRLKADAFAKLGDFDQAIALLETQSPDSRDWRWHMAKAGVELQRSEWHKAEQHYRFVLQSQPNHANAHHNLALTLLSQKKWQEGWREYEWRRSNPRSTANGSPSPIPATGKLHDQIMVVVGEQGIGDQIMMMRFLPELATRCRSLIVKVESRLLDLFQRVLPDSLQIEDKKNMSLITTQRTFFSLAAEVCRSSARGPYPPIRRPQLQSASNQIPTWSDTGPNN